MLVLVAFVTHQFFLVGRYVSLLNLLAVPLVASGLALLMQRFARWKALMLVLALLTMAANVVSLSPGKTHIVEAGRWLGANATDPARVGVDNARIAYYAGWRTTDAIIQDRTSLASALAEKRADMVAIEATRKDPELEKWLAENRLQVVQRFANKAGDAVIIAVPETTQSSPSTTGREVGRTPLRWNSQPPRDGGPLRPCAGADRHPEPVARCVAPIPPALTPDSRFRPSPIASALAPAFVDTTGRPAAMYCSTLRAHLPRLQSSSRIGAMPMCEAASSRASASARHATGTVVTPQPGRSKSATIFRRRPGTFSAAGLQPRHRLRQVLARRMAADPHQVQRVGRLVRARRCSARHRRRWEPASPSD